MTTLRQEVPCRAVVALDKFKGSVDAATAVGAVASGIRASAPETTVVEMPMADGGDGTVDAAVASGFDRVFFGSVGPLGRATRASLALSGPRAVVEVANSCGLQLVGEGAMDPLSASSYGLGLAIRAALERGATEIVVGLGGSASSDGGAGMLTALGAQLLDSEGERLPLGVTGLISLCDVDLTELDPRLAKARFTLACDVRNPLLGDDGTARVYARQKGAGSGEIDLIERALGRLAEVTSRLRGANYECVAGSGAAGGIGYAGLAYLDAQMASGAKIVIDLVGLADQLVGADLVVAGEGQLDWQSQRGKAPTAVAEAAGAVGAPTIAVVGRCLLGRPETTALGLAAVYELMTIEPDERECMAHAAELLDVVGRRVVADGWLPSAGGCHELLQPTPAARRHVGVVGNRESGSKDRPATAEGGEEVQQSPGEEAGS